MGYEKKKKEVPLVLCMEATGVYHENCALYFLKENNTSIFANKQSII
jgi:transposase